MAANGEPANKKKKVPAYAVINLDQDADVSHVLNHLMQGGYTNVTFISQIFEHPDAIAHTANEVNKAKGEAAGASGANGGTSIPYLRDGPAGSFGAVRNPADITDLPAQSKRVTLTRPGPRTNLRLRDDDSVDLSYNDIQDITPDQLVVGSSQSRGPHQITNGNANVAASALNLKRHAYMPSRYIERHGLPHVRPQEPLRREYDGKLWKVARVNAPLPTRSLAAMPIKLASRPSPAVQQQLPLDEANIPIATCRICNNNIRFSRMSNLTNHVRRHAEQKQFCCVHCSYQHSEMSKVRFHLTSNHKDNESVPLDNMTPELQRTWNSLLDQCFPNHQELLRSHEQELRQELRPRNVPFSISSSFSSAPPAPKRDIMQNCVECGDAVAVREDNVQEANKIYEDHIREKHMGEASAYQCTECPFLNICEKKLQHHVAARHPESAGQSCIVEQPMVPYVHLFIPRYFPNADVGMRDREDQLLTANLENDVIKWGQNADKGTSESRVKTEETDGSEENFEQADLSSDDFDDNDRSISGDSMTTLEQKYGSRSSSQTSTANRISCTLCSKSLAAFTGRAAMFAMMSHAKRHYGVKQFECGQCSYGSSDEAHVRSHLGQRHGSQEPAINRHCEEMQIAWIHTMIRCFPEAKDRIEKFDFNLELDSSIKTEDTLEPTTPVRDSPSPVSGCQLEEIEEIDNPEPSLSPAPSTSFPNRSARHSYGTRNNRNRH